MDDNLSYLNILVPAINETLWFRYLNKPPIQEDLNADGYHTLTLQEAWLLLENLDVLNYLTKFDKNLLLEYSPQKLDVFYFALVATCQFTMRFIEKASREILAPKFVEILEYDKNHTESFYEMIIIEFQLATIQLIRSFVKNYYFTYRDAIDSGKPDGLQQIMCRITKRMRNHIRTALRDNCQSHLDCVEMNYKLLIQDFDDKVLYDIAMQFFQLRDAENHNFDILHKILISILDNSINVDATLNLIMTTSELNYQNILKTELAVLDYYREYFFDGNYCADPKTDIPYYHFENFEDLLSAERKLLAEIEHSLPDDGDFDADESINNYLLKMNVEKEFDLGRYWMNIFVIKHYEYASYKVRCKLSNFIKLNAMRDDVYSLDHKMTLATCYEVYHGECAEQYDFADIPGFLESNHMGFLTWGMEFLLPLVSRIYNVRIRLLKFHSDDPNLLINNTINAETVETITLLRYDLSKKYLVESDPDWYYYSLKNASSEATGIAPPIVNFRPITSYLSHYGNGNNFWGGGSTAKLVKIKPGILEI